MLETFAALFLAHVAADYLAQTERMVATKDKSATLALHVVIVFALAMLAVGFVGWGVLVALAIAHAAIDILKTHALPPRLLWPYLLDQVLHIATIVVAAAIAPNLLSAGLWGSLAPEAIDRLTIVFLLLAFAIFAVRAGGFAIDLAWKPQPEGDPGGPLSGSSRGVGQVERGLVFGLVLIGQPLFIALVLVAKPFLGLRQVRSGPAMTRYLIGTTAASFGWAIGTAIVLLMVLPNGALETWALNP